MEGATAASKGAAPIGAASARNGTHGPVGARRLAALAVCVVAVFAAAFAVGSMTKKHSAPPAAPAALVPASATGTQHVTITAISPASTVPGLKPKPKPKVKPPVTTTPSQSTQTVVPTQPQQPQQPQQQQQQHSSGGGTSSSGGSGSTSSGSSSGSSSGGS